MILAGAKDSNPPPNDYGPWSPGGRHPSLHRLADDGVVVLGDEAVDPSLEEPAGEQVEAPVGLPEATPTCGPTPCPRGGASPSPATTAACRPPLCGVTRGDGTSAMTPSHDRPTPSRLSRSGAPGIDGTRGPAQTPLSSPGWTVSMRMSPCSIAGRLGRSAAVRTGGVRGSTPPPASPRSRRRTRAPHAHDYDDWAGM